MTGLRKATGTVSSIVVGVLVGALLTLGLGGQISSDDTLPDTPSSPSPSAPDLAGGKGAGKQGGTTLLAWTASGIDAGTLRAVGKVPGVEGVTRLVAGIDWIAKTETEEGTVIDLPRRDRYIPLDIAIVDPVSYSEFVKPGERQLIRSLDARHVVLSETGAELRSARPGMRIKLRDRVVTVAGIIADETARGYEALAGGVVPGSWSRTYPFLLIALEKPSVRSRVRARIEGSVGVGTPLRIRGEGETPFLRYGDSVLSEAYVKERFGEFSAIPLPDGTLDVDPSWRDAYIVTRPMPIFGEVTCNRVIIPQMRSGLREIVERGLEHLITADFGGCYSPRTIISGPGARLSHHAYGIAFDLNVGENGYGRQPTLDPRIVDIFEKQGFTWGGRWLVPDGMHFEWSRFPEAD